MSVSYREGAGHKIGSQPIRDRELDHVGPTGSSAGGVSGLSMSTQEVNNYMINER